MALGKYINDDCVEVPRGTGGRNPYQDTVVFLSP